MEKITDWLYTGGKTTTAAIAHHKIGYVINISGIPAEYKVDSVLKIADRGSNNDPKQFVEILKEIDKARKEEKTPIFLMCHAGVSRSPAIAALYLYYKHEFASLDEALEYITKQNRMARPNPNLVDFIKAKVLPLL